MTIISPSGRCGRRAVEELTDALALLTAAGLGIRDALGVSRSLFRQGPTARLIAAVVLQIDRGVSFSTAIGRMEGAFPPLYRSLLRIGERGGGIERVLARLSSHLRRERAVRSALYTALLYPALVLLIAVVSVLLVSLLVLPRIRELMPVSAGAPSALAINLLSVGCALLVCAACAAAVLRRRCPRVARQVDRMVIALPLVGGAVLSGQLERFCFAMATLTGSGMAVVEALEESARTVSNLSVREALSRCGADARRGLRLSAAFLGQAILPERLSRWIAVGERTGKVEQVFAQLTAYYDAEVELTSNRVTTLAEPTIILVVGVGVIILLCTFFLPLLSVFSGMV